MSLLLDAYEERSGRFIPQLGAVETKVDVRESGACICRSKEILNGASARAALSATR